MSASREKKSRQDLAAQGVTDPKKIREAEEKAKARKTNTLYGVIAGVFVLVAALLLVYNSGVLQRNATAVTINGEKYTAGQVEYFYANVKSSLLKSGYASFYGIDTSKSLDQQVVSDTMKTALGIEDEGDVTWEQYVRDTAVKQLAMYVLTAQEAEANGMGADEHTQEELDATMEELNAAAKQNGYSTKTYLKLIYGKNMTVDTFKEMVQLVDVATHYQSHYAEELSYTTADLEAYYQENQSTFDVADYESLYFKGTADSTTDADGNTVAATDEENAAAKAQAESDAAAVLARVQAGESLEDVAKDYESATFSHTESGSNSGDDMGTWLFDSARVDGDSTVITTDSGSRVLVFHSAGRQDYATKDVRHILFMVNKNDLDSTSESYDADLQARQDEAKAKAEDALAQWKAGDATEDSFAALANELSEDGGSNTNGGLYTEIYKGQMVTEFNDWCFDSSRQAGDTGIVYNENTGYHVMYFVGDDIPYWQVQADSALRSRDTSAWLEELLASATVEQGSGMKNLA
jgi:parvulin-like peptidyl-prolyl isomerase